MVTTGALTGSRYLVIGEPTGLDMCIAQKGIARWVVTVHGVAAHSSTPHLGASAVSYAARAILALEACPFPFTPHAFLSEPTLTVSNVQSSTAGNIVPDTCSFTAVLRTVPGMEPADLNRQVEEILGSLAADSEGRITVEHPLQGSIPAVDTPPSSPLVGAMADALTDVAGRAPRVRGFTGGTEAAALSPAFDLPFVVCGPGRLDVAHQADEWVEVAELETAARAYMLLAQRLSRDSSSVSVAP
jgi:acetylornithine deacetylase/succinyl-diaminopimelate desuccinylase-like protein